MSGFVGIVHRDGRPVDPGQLRSLTESLRFRGPDGLRTWHRGSVGLGHTLFVTHAARDGEPQPIALDERYWIVGHIRLDAREDLISALCHSERSEESRSASDTALVLRAYRAWGPECVKRIHGDFSFGIWDEANQRLFCARDPFGVRPFFYAEFDDMFLFSNTLNCLRRHPRVSDRLYEPALADYLMVGNPLEPDRSFFADIRRMAPGHTLVLSRDEVRTNKYFSLPVEPYLQYKKPDQYVEHFKDVFARAVADRAGSGALSVFLSGGLDSAMIATAASGAWRHVQPTVTPHAFCASANQLFLDPEPDHASITAEALGIPLRTWQVRDCMPFRNASDAGSEPDDNIYRFTFLTHLENATAHSRIALDGQGGDELLCGEPLLQELRHLPQFRLAASWFRSWIRARTRPALGLRAMLLGQDAGQSLSPSVPGWIDQAWASSLKLENRLATLRTAQSHIRLPRSNSRRHLRSPLWPTYFEGHDAGNTSRQLEVRWPFFDERVIGIGLRLPSFPWCFQKQIEREALMGHLPTRITRRKKTSLQGSPLGIWLAQQPEWHETLAWMGRYLRDRVDLERWQKCWTQPSEFDGMKTTWAWSYLRPVGLAHWLKVQESVVR